MRHVHPAPRVPGAYGGSTWVDDTVFRYKTEPYQACRDGPNFALMRRCNCCDRIARLERGTQAVVFVGAPGKPVPPRRPGGVVQPLRRLCRPVLRQRAFDQTLPFAIGQ